MTSRSTLLSPSSIPDAVGVSTTTNGGTASPVPPEASSPSNNSCHSHPNLGASINYRDQPNTNFLQTNESSGGHRKGSHVSQTAMSKIHHNYQHQRDNSLPSSSDPPSGSGSPVPPSGSSAAASNLDPKKSRKMLNQWKHAAAVSSKIGNRLKNRNLLGKWRSQSQSVDICPGSTPGSFDSGTLGTGIGIGSDPAVFVESGSGTPAANSSNSIDVTGKQPASGEPKTTWSEHVWKCRREDVTVGIWIADVCNQCINITALLNDLFSLLWGHDEAIMLRKSIRRVRGSSGSDSSCGSSGGQQVHFDLGGGRAVSPNHLTASAATAAVQLRKKKQKSRDVQSANSSPSIRSPGKTSSATTATTTTEAPKKKKFDYIVHTAWVHRGFTDDVTEVTTVQPGGDLLTEFQKDKFRYFFHHVLDLNSDYVISAEDFEKLNERIRHYMDWSVNSIQFLAVTEVHMLFLECFLQTAAKFEKPDDGHSETRNPEQLFEHWKLGFPIGAGNPKDYRFDYWDPFKKLDALYDKMEHVTITDVLNDEPEVEPKTCVTIDEWVDVWGTLVGNKKTLDELPMWLQCYPKILFDVINRAGTGLITKSELRYFYTAFMDVGKLGEEKLDEITENAFHAMTSGGDFQLDYHTFRLSFLNFLFGKQPYGPGQFMFGTVKPKTETCMFPIDYSAMNATEEDIEPFGPNKLQDKGSRRSVLV